MVSRNWSTLILGVLISPVHAADEMEGNLWTIARRVIVRNLELEGVKPDTEAYRSRMQYQLESKEGNVISGSVFGGVASFTGRLITPSISMFNYRSAISADERSRLPVLDESDIRRLVSEFMTLLEKPSELVWTVELRGDVAYVSGRKVGPHGHRVDTPWQLSFNRRGGILTQFISGPNDEMSYLLPPKIPSGQAGLIALAEYQHAGMFAITEIHEPSLMAGYPMNAEEYEARIAMDRINEFVSARKVMSYWRIGFSSHDGEAFTGEVHIVEVDAQTGQIVGQARMARLGGSSEPTAKPVISWNTISSVTVAGDKENTIGKVAPIETKSLPGGKPIAVHSAKFVFACRYDAKTNVLWRRIPGGGYEPGRPDAKLTKVLTRLVARK